MFVSVGVVVSTALTAGTIALGAHAVRELPQKWAHWRYSREVNISPEAVSLIAIELPEAVYANSSNHLADVRIADDQGREIPYVLHVPTSESRSERRGVRTLEQSYAPGEFTQFVFDAGLKPRFYNAIEVLTTESDFIAWAEVAVSDDSREWRIVCDRAPLFRFSKQNLQGTQTLHFSETSARYIRLRVLEGSKRFSLSRVELLYQMSPPEERTMAAAQFRSVASGNPNESVWEADLPTDLPVNELWFETSEPEFSRLVTIESREDGSDWQSAGSGEIYRFRHDDWLREWLRVSFGGGWSAHWRVHVANGNNAPLADVRITLYMMPRRLIFRADPARRYRVLYGQSQAKAPLYDLGRTIYAKDMSRVPAATLGPEELNAAYEDPRPWTEKHPAVLWISVIVAAGLLGFAALRSLRASSN